MERCPVCNRIESRERCADCAYDFARNDPRPAIRRLTGRLRTTSAFLRVSAAFTVVWPFAILAPLDVAVFVFVVGLVVPVGFVIGMFRRAEIRRQLTAASELVPQLPVARVVKS